MLFAKGFESSNSKPPPVPNLFKGLCTSLNVKGLIHIGEGHIRWSQILRRTPKLSMLVEDGFIHGHTILGVLICDVFTSECAYVYPENSLNANPGRDALR